MGQAETRQSESKNKLILGRIKQVNIYIYIYIYIFWEGKQVNIDMFV